MCFVCQSNPKCTQWVENTTTTKLLRGVLLALYFTQFHYIIFYSLISRLCAVHVSYALYLNVEYIASTYSFIRCAVERNGFGIKCFSLHLFHFISFFFLCILLWKSSRLEPVWLINYYIMQLNLFSSWLYFFFFVLYVTLQPKIENLFNKSRRI